LSRDEILLKVRERITGFAASRYRRDLSEDLAQEVFVVLEEKYRHVSTVEELLPLAFEIMRFKLMGWRNRELRRGETTQLDVTEIPLADPGPGQDVLIDRQRRLDRLTAGLSGLGERCRNIFRWKLEGKGFPEIQKLLGADSINTVYTWDARCRKELQAKMAGQENGGVK
jgi:RNA polymerase sigma-70 factor, ECF subfamily